MQVYVLEAEISSFMLVASAKRLQLKPSCVGKVSEMDTYTKHCACKEELEPCSFISGVARPHMVGSKKSGVWSMS